MDVVLAGMKDFDTIMEIPSDDGEGNNTKEEEDQSEGPAAKKQQGQMPKKLSKTSFHVCFPAPPDGKHVNLIQIHLHTWAAAMIGPNKLEGVDLDNPPNTKIFNTTYTDSTDISMLARCHLNTVSQCQTAAPNIIINNDFKDFAALLHRHQRNDPAGPPDNHPHTVNAQPPGPQPLRPALEPKMNLKDFCEQFLLSFVILQKLNFINLYLLNLVSCYVSRMVEKFPFHVISCVTTKHTSYISKIEVWGTWGQILNAATWSHGINITLVQVNE
ncbi:hypothetical protein BS17DRAFT_765208 [Gyrodon lividus]|nr:hypothetical protein BS17DRAFT_765208 [Gyrodon lividus]